MNAPLGLITAVTFVVTLLALTHVLAQVDTGFYQMVEHVKVETSYALLLYSSYFFPPSLPTYLFLFLPPSLFPSLSPFVPPSLHSLPPFYSYLSQILMNALVIMAVVMGVRTQLVHTGALVQMATSCIPTNSHVKVYIIVVIHFSFSASPTCHTIHFSPPCCFCIPPYFL